MPLPFTVADRLALTLDGLGRSVAARVGAGVLTAAMIVLVWVRLRRVERQMLGLLARFRAGRLRVVAVPRVGGGGGRGGRVAVLPRRFGWLLGLVPGEAASFAGQMRSVLAEPEMVALMATAPQARRVLRPVCRMLGIEVAGAGQPGGASEPGRPAVMPPSTTSSAPVMYDEASEARNKTTLATSCGVPSMPVGTPDSAIARGSGGVLRRAASPWGIFRQIAVSIIPGWTLLQRMRSRAPAHSMATDLAKRRTAPLVAA